MNDQEVPDLAFPQISTGSHGASWGLRGFLYRGGASTDRRRVVVMIERGELGQPLSERIPLMLKVHEALDAKLARENSVNTVTQLITHFSDFVAWVDDRASALSLATVRDAFLSWVEHLIGRYRIKKEINQDTAYGTAAAVAGLIGLALEYKQSEPGGALMKHTRMRRPKKRKRVLGINADKQNLSDTFEFGHLMTDLCEGLKEDAVRGPLPISIPLRDGRTAVVKGELKAPDLDLASASNGDRKRALLHRAPLATEASAIDERPSVLNLRIEAELLIFVAQTGMNLAQAAQLRREQYRWQSDGDELNAFRVYKGRRGGEVIFRCFKAYRDHLRRYLSWLDAVGLGEADERLFPFLYFKGKIPAEHSTPQFQAILRLCKQLGVKHFKSRALRRTRVNWLLRRSRNPNLTAEQSGHTKETLLRVYEEPHLQSAAIEIMRYHEATDPTVAPPGPGLCVGAGRPPEAIKNTPPEAPEPDCVSPEGCLFCIYHRDVMSADYCWKLASHSRLKSLEALLSKPPRSLQKLPANAVVDRIEAKLGAIAEGSEIRALWTRDAKDAVIASKCHPFWDGHIQLLETLNEST